MIDFIPTLLAFSEDPLEHVINQSMPAWQQAGKWIWSSTQGNLVLSGLIMILVGLWTASKIKTGPVGQGADAYVTRSRFAHMIEVICVYLREEVARPLLHDRTNSLMPFLWTIFFFILTNNVLGLIPLRDLLHIGHIDPWFGGTATQNFFVTATLAIIAALVFNVAAVIRLGPVGFIKHMFGGLPWYMAPIGLLLFVIEAAGQFIIKPVALALRLFANMTAGHVLLATLIGFAGKAVGSALHGGGWGINGTVTFLTAGGAILLTFLELFVAVLQAFVFMFLTTVFISLMDHHDEHGHEHEHDHAKGHEHAHA